MLGHDQARLPILTEKALDSRPRAGHRRFRAALSNLGVVALHAVGTAGSGAVVVSAEDVERVNWIMLSTMCRVGELSMARWENVDFDKAEWFIPKSDVEGRFGNLDVFLSEFALDQFRQLHALTGDTPWCFPSPLRQNHIDTKSITKQVGDRQVMFKKSRDGRPRQPMKNRPHDNLLVLDHGKNGAWTSHDLRRTGATMMQALGISLDVIDRCQNHVLPGSKVRRHYMHYDYADEKREAWSMLGKRLA